MTCEDQATEWHETCAAGHHVATMWTVTGTLDGRPYSLTWADGGIREAPAFLRQRLALHEGKTVGITPTGPFVPLKPDNEAAVLAALRYYSHVEDVDGDTLPWPELPDGAVG